MTDPTKQHSSHPGKLQRQCQRAPDADDGVALGSTPAQLAAACLFLASPVWSSDSTGMLLPVTGNSGF